MSDRSMAIVPRRRRGDQAPAAPLDPFVTELVCWIARHERGVAFNALAKLAADELNWPLPFAEAVLTAARTRRLLTVMQSTARGAYRADLSNRGRDWLDRHLPATAADT